MLESLLVYCSLFGVMCICGISAAGKQQKYVSGSGMCQENKPFWSIELLIIAIAFAFVFGCRWGVGRDYFRYLGAYLGDVPERYEFLYQNVSKLLQILGAHFSVYFGLWAFVDIVLIYYSIRNYRFIFPYVAFFLIFGSHYLPMMNAMRQYLAVVVFMCAIQFVDQKKPKLYYLLCIIAFLFHKLAIVVVVIYPILRFRNDWFKSYFFQLILLCVALFLNLHGEYLIQMIEAPFEWITDSMGYERYSYELLFQDRYDRGRFGRGTGIGLWFNVILTLFVIFTSKELKKYYNSSYFNMMYTLYFAGVLFSLIFGQSIILNRLAMFFSLYKVIIYSFFVYYCYEKRTYAHFIMASLMILIQLPLFINMITNPDSTAAYQFFWEGNIQDYYNYYGLSLDSLL